MAKEEHDSTGCKVNISILFSILANIEFMLIFKAGRKIPPAPQKSTKSGHLLLCLEEGKKNGFQTRKLLKGHPDAEQNSSCARDEVASCCLLEAVACALLSLFSSALFEAP